MILYHKSNLIYIIVFPQFLIFQQNNSAQTSLLIFFTSRHYYLFEKLKIVDKELCNLNCSYGKVSHTLKGDRALSKLIILLILNKKEFNHFFKSRSSDIVLLNIRMLSAMNRATLSAKRMIRMYERSEQIFFSVSVRGICKSFISNRKLSKKLFSISDVKFPFYKHSLTRIS